MPTTNDRLSQQAMEVSTDLKEMGGIVKDAAQETFGQLRSNVSEHYEEGRDKVLSLERTAEQYLRQRPFMSVLVAAGIGLLVGRYCMRSLNAALAWCSGPSIAPARAVRQRALGR
jgi:ElaB/YqjD/DUF883 family membrane-anchored ribosome-binding protein